MSIKIYTMKNIIRKNVSGAIDLNKTKELVRKLAEASASLPEHNILIDLRDTTVSGVTMADAIAVTLEIMDQMGPFVNKIANIVPEETERLAFAKKLEACLIMKDYQYKVFTGFEEAIEWLSEVKNLEEN